MGESGPQHYGDGSPSAWAEVAFAAVFLFPRLWSNGGGGVVSSCYTQNFHHFSLKSPDFMFLDKFY